MDSSEWLPVDTGDSGEGKKKLDERAKQIYKRSLVFDGVSPVLLDDSFLLTASFDTQTCEERRVGFPLSLRLATTDARI